MENQLTHIIIIFFISISLQSFPVTIAAGENPFTAKASLIRYWNKQISNTLRKPEFLISKASPLNAIDLAFFTKLATQNSLSTQFNSFCSSANLYCSFDSVPTPILKNDDPDANFILYSNKNFQNYGIGRIGGTDSFKNYSDDLNSATDSFKRYSRSSTGHHEIFTNYAHDANVAIGSFSNYGSDASGGSGEFSNYHDRVNVPTLRFTTYDSDGNDHKLKFTTYSDETNSGSESFASYGKKGNGVPAEFKSYGDNSNIIGSTFTAYGESGNSANDSFTSYGESGNNPHNNFKNYGNGGNAGIDSFSSYRDQANVGDDSFQSYARNSNAGKASFSNYGKTFNRGNDSFKEYGKDSVGRTAIGFNSYSVDRSFKDYSKNGATFSRYSNFSSKSGGGSDGSGNSVNKWVEEGKFFRESMIEEGNVMMMPDLTDKMPARSFLPRSLLTKLPFSTAGLPELQQIFHAPAKSGMERVLKNALDECERAPSAGETKRCVGSVEDMIDFSISVLGSNVAVRTTENVNGSTKMVMIGLVKGINGGDVTKSVSCHQSLYPYLLYYCHSVPNVRVYEVEILDLESNGKINSGVAICHLDTSAWSPRHGAFVALGSKPGQIEICHWIFENDMTWTIAD